jgi:hypothetical protein
MSTERKFVILTSGHYRYTLKSSAGKSDTNVQNIPRNACLTSGSYYSKTPSMQLKLDRKDAGLSDIPECQTDPIFTKFLQVNFMLLQ